MVVFLSVVIIILLIVICRAISKLGKIDGIYATCIRNYNRIVTEQTGEKTINYDR